MTSALARQTAPVLVDLLLEGVKTVALFPCFHANQGLKVVSKPEYDGSYPYSVVHSSGYTIPTSWTCSLPRAIAFCDLCVAQIPELTEVGLIFNHLPKPRKQKIKEILFQINDQLDQEFPEPDEE